MQRLKTTVGNLLVPGNNQPWPEVRDTLNRVLLGWSNYFSYGTRRAPLRGVDRYVYERVRDFLVPVGWETGRWPSAPSYRAHPRLYQKRRLIELTDWSACWGEADPP